MTRTQMIAAGAGVALVAFGGAMVVAKMRGVPPGGQPAAAAGLSTTLAIEPFSVAGPAPRSWSSAVFAESLRARLANTPGLTVRQAGGTFWANIEFTVRGDVAARDGRLVTAVRLYRRGERDALWTATFWRGEALTSDLVGDVAGAIAEAVYGALARSSVTATGGRP